MSTLKTNTLDTPSGSGNITVNRPTVLTAGDIITADIADNAVTLAKMAGGTDGQIITYDASGDPVAVGPGTSGQVLTSAGANAPPTFAAAAAAGNYSSLAKADLHISAVQVISHGTWTRMELDLEDFDADGDYDSTTNDRFVVPTTGQYLCITWSRWNANSDGDLFGCGFYINGSRKTFALGAASSASAATQCMANIFDLTASDYVEGWCYQASGSNKDLEPSGDGSPFLAVTRVG
jgi:hypothetical protein